MAEKALERMGRLWHFVRGRRIEGGHEGLGLSSDFANMTGDCSGLQGDCSGIWGDCTGVYGDCTRLWGDLDECELTPDERVVGMDIAELVEEADDGDEDS